MLIVWAFIYVLAITNDSALIYSLLDSQRIYGQKCVCPVTDCYCRLHQVKNVLLAISGSMAILVLAVVAV